MIKFIVHMEISIRDFNSSGATRLDASKVASALNQEKNVFIFDTLDDAKFFVRSRGLGTASSALFGLFSLTDHPIFEVEADHFPSRNKLFEAIDESKIITVYYGPDMPHPTLTQAKIFQESTGLQLHEHSLINVYSALNKHYALNNKHTHLCTIA